MKLILALFTFSFSFLVLVGCGYKPTTHYAKQELGENGTYYVNMKISVNSAKNAVFIKDSINEAIISKFGGSLVSSPSLADITMDASLSSVSTSAIQYDTDGYATLYRTTVSIKVSYKSKKSSGSFSVSDAYEFGVGSSAVVSDSAKYDAIKIAASKAFDKIISSIAVQTFKSKKPKTVKSTDSNTTKNVKNSK